jgi:hypothetical protein
MAPSTNNNFNSENLIDRIKKEIRRVYVNGLVKFTAFGMAIFNNNDGSIHSYRSYTSVFIRRCCDAL